MRAARYYNNAEERTDMTEQYRAARREMRRLLLARKDEELLDAYYRVRTLSEHEARRETLKHLDDYGVALMMIREGATDPKAVAADALRKYELR